MFENKNNEVNIAGEVVGDFVYSHEVFGEGFYLLHISVNRLSDSKDIIPLMISEKLLDVNDDHKGCYVEVNGEFRSYNQHEDNKNRLALFVFVKEIRICEKGYGSLSPNHIFLEGYICKKPVYRKTPSGREITDLFLAVNRLYGKSDYIPCICWSRNARLVAQFEVGSHIQIWGRIQSREYQKKLSETEFEKRTAYEVSIREITGIEIGEKGEEKIDKKKN